MTATSNKMVYEFTTDDDELDDKKTDQATMCNFYKLNLPANASLLSKQIAKSQAKRAEKEKRKSRRIDLSTVREQDETRGSASEDHSSALSTPAPPKAPEEEPPTESLCSRSRIDSAPLNVRLMRQASLPESERKNEPMDDEEARLLAMLLSGIANNKDNNKESDAEWREAARKFSLPANNAQLPPLPPIINRALPSPGLPKMMPNAKVSEWLLERSESPDNLSIGTSVMLEDSGLVLNYQNDEDEDEFFDAEEENVIVKAEEPQNDGDVVVLEHEMQGLSLNRNMAMTQSLVRVEEETIQDYGTPQVDPRSARSTSVSPRPTNDQFARNSPVNATFNVKHSGTLGRNPKMSINGNMSTSSHLTSTPLASRTARSVLRVHNVNSVANTSPRQINGQLEQLDISPINRLSEKVGMTHRKPEPPINRIMSASQHPPTVTVSSTPSRPASVASGMAKTSNLEGLQDLIHMQEEALRKAALDSQAEQLERKLSWHSDNEPNRKSIHSSVGSLSSSKSMDGNHTLNKFSSSRIPTPRSRLPTPKVLPKRVQSVAAAVRFTTSKPQHAGIVNGGTPNDECF